MYESIHLLRDTRIPWSSALNSGYWQDKIEKRVIAEIAFTRLRHIYRTLPVSIEQNDATAVFQRAMNAILISLNWNSTPTYPNDIIIFSETVEKYAS